MSGLFDTKGRFTPLSDAQLGTLNPEQRTAYDELASEVAKLDAANVEAESAITANRSAVAALRDAEAREAKKPKWTALDEQRAAIAQWRHDHV